jgi:hypothetical protein
MLFRAEGAHDASTYFFRHASDHSGACIASVVSLLSVGRLGNMGSPDRATAAQGKHRQPRVAAKPACAGVLRPVVDFDEKIVTSSSEVIEAVAASSAKRQ